MATEVLRSVLGVRSSTPSLSVLREYGIEPIQLNWFRTTVHFCMLLSLQQPSPNGPDTLLIGDNYLLIILET
eukprot:1160763-Pelagomonas_calceolata.AAC.14